MHEREIKTYKVKNTFEFADLIGYSRFLRYFSYYAKDLTKQKIISVAEYNSLLTSNKPETHTAYKKFINEINDNYTLEDLINELGFLLANSCEKDECEKDGGNIIIHIYEIVPDNVSELLEFIARHYTDYGITMEDISRVVVEHEL